MLREWFDDQMARMCDLKAHPSGMDAHFEVLSDIPPDVLIQGITHALKTRPWFPTPAELRADCDAALRRVPIVVGGRRKFVDVANAQRVEIRNPFAPDLPIVLFITRDWDHDCTNCEDYGFASRWCGAEGHARFPWMVAADCQRQDEHLPHEWVERCPCIATNPTIQRRKASQMRYSQAPERVA
jgi:hypothetical protein